MKLAEALLLRSEYQQKIDSLTQRIMVNLKIQENEEPFEDPDVLMADAMRLNDELCLLIKGINKKNSEARLPSGQTIAEALAERDSLMKKRHLLSSIADGAGQRDFRVSHAEIKMYTTIDVAKVQKEIDSLSQQFRQLDTQIQAQNWLIDLE